MKQLKDSEAFPQSFADIFASCKPLSLSLLRSSFEMFPMHATSFSLTCIGRVNSIINVLHVRRIVFGTAERAHQNANQGKSHVNQPQICIQRNPAIRNPVAQRAAAA